MNGVKSIQSKYPGIDLLKTVSGWEVNYSLKNITKGHEAHFARVTEKFLAVF
jgi:hypothetical protein